MASARSEQCASAEATAWAPMRWAQSYPYIPDTDLHSIGVKVADQIDPRRDGTRLDSGYPQLTDSDCVIVQRSGTRQISVETSRHHAEWTVVMSHCKTPESRIKDPFCVLDPTAKAPTAHYRSINGECSFNSFKSRALL